MSKEIAEQVNVTHYCYTVCWSDEDQAYVARVAEFPSLAAHGKTPAGALREIQGVVQSVIDDLVESGEPIPVPFAKEKYSGKFNVRVPESMHRNLVIKAAQEGVSLNQFINLNLVRSLTADKEILFAADYERKAIAKIRRVRKAAKRK